MGNLLDAKLTLAALEAAIASRRPCPGLIHHSDRGSQYAAKDYRHRLDQLCIRGSMTRKGNPYDNAYAECLLKTLKHEEINMYEYRTMGDVIERLPLFLEEVYNRRRLHSALGYMPPEEFEEKYLQQREQNPGSICLPDGGHST